jgi:hypothetical protein
VRHKKNLFREVNELISGISGHSPGDDRLGFVCECADCRCVQHVFLRLAEYESLRQRPDLFVIAPGHRVAPFQRVIEQNTRFALVRGRRDVAEPAA